MRHWFLEQLAMYAAYHRDKRNQATHHVGVPLIVYALLVALTQIPIGNLELGSLGIYPISVATLVLIALMALYLLNVPLIGVLACVIYGILYVLAEAVGRSEPSIVWSTFAACFVGGWIIQFVGHAFEGRRPALFTNVTQVFMAPPFLIAEMLFSLGFQKSLDSEILARSGKFDRAPSSA
ncbi:MAG: Mpo1-like protein [Rhodospirillaceae bacterium]|nr:Mpo1-like protein [Rhodospirillaceae bacterium]